MDTRDTLTTAQLFRLASTSDAPFILDVRIDEDRALDPRALPRSIRRDHRTVASWAHEYAGKPVAVVSQDDLKLSQGVAARLRYAGVHVGSVTIDLPLPTGIDFATLGLAILAACALFCLTLGVLCTLRITAGAGLALRLVVSL